MGPGDIFGPLAEAQRQGLLGGPAWGAPMPPYKAGKYYWPYQYLPMSTGLAITANLIYRAWMFIGMRQTFLGAWFANTGTGDSGKKLRMGVWDQNDVLLKDFGETVLNGSAAMRPVANAVSLPIGWIQVGLVSDTAPAVKTMRTQSYTASSGFNQVNPIINMTGAFPASVAGAGWYTLPEGDTAPFTYGALPNPLTAATATIVGTNNADPLGEMPAMGLYL